MKRSMSLLLAFILAFTSFVIPASATLESNTEAQAGVLNQLMLLKGDGNGFNLGGSLSRSEAPPLSSS